MECFRLKNLFNNFGYCRYDAMVISYMLYLFLNSRGYKEMSQRNVHKEILFYGSLQKNRLMCPIPPIFRVKNVILNEEPNDFDLSQQLHCIN